MTCSHVAAITVLVLWPVLGRAQAPPRPPTICRNCWPTECGAGTWIATRQLHAYPHPSDSLPAAFSIDSGRTFQVDSSIVRVTQFARAVLRQRHGRHAAGDTVLITGYSGEGYYSIWWRGRSGNERSFWDPGSSVAQLLVPLQQQWWLHVRQGRTPGWIAMSDSAPAHNVECP
jgi:hypothetical protein